MACEKDICLFCRCFYMDTGHPAFSDVTPGDDFTLECMMGVWEVGDSLSQDDFRHIMDTGLTCRFFLHHESEHYPSCPVCGIDKPTHWRDGTLTTGRDRNGIPGARCNHKRDGA